MSTHWSRRGPAAAAAVGLLLAAGCGSSSGGGSTGDAGAATYAKGELAKYTAAHDTYPSPGPAIPGGVAGLRGKTVFFIPIGLKISYFQNIQAGMREALGKVGVDLRGCDGGFTPSGVAACINQAVGENAAAVVTNSVPYELAPTAYSALAAKGIPVYLAGSPLPAGKSNSAAMAFGDSAPLLGPVARLSADAIIADSNGTAKVLYIKVIDSSSLAAMGDAGIAEFRDHCPQCTVTVKTINTATLHQLPSVVSGALISDPDINYVLPQTDADVSGAVTGIQNAHYTGKVKGATANGDLSGLQLLKQRSFLIADVGYSANYLAWENVDAALRMMSGQTPPAQYPNVIRVFTPDKVGDLTLTPQAAATGAWFGSDAFKAQYLALWGLG
jgi:ribose transport system substrate-binding protein